jgi:L-arabinose isomerase
MGEFNPACAGDRPRLVEKDFPWTSAKTPAIITAPPQPGPAVLVNLAPQQGDAFCLILAPVEVLGETTNPAMRDTIRGWFRPQRDLESFLEAYSRHGGTHHCALVHGTGLEALAAFARYAGIQCVVIGEESTVNGKRGSVVSGLRAPVS